MRISDWSSDVCSSDLTSPRCGQARPAHSDKSGRMRLPPGKAGETAKVPWHPTHACLVTRVAPGRCANQADPRIALDSSERLDWRPARQIKDTKTSPANAEYASASTAQAAGTDGPHGTPEN